MHSAIYTQAQTKIVATQFSFLTLLIAPQHKKFLHILNVFASDKCSDLFKLISLTTETI